VKVSEKYQVVLLGGLVLMAMFNLTLVSPGLKVFIEDRFEETSSIYTGIFFSAEMIAYIIFAPLWGVLSDRRERRVPFVAIGLGVSALLFASIPFIPNYWMLVGVRFVQGAFTVAAWSLAMTMALDWAGEANRGRTMGVLGAGMMMGMALGAPIGGAVTDNWSISGPFFVAAMVFTVAFIITLIFLSEPTSRREKRKADIPLSEERDLWIPSAFGFVERFTAGFFITLFPSFVQDVLGLSIGLSGMYLGLFFLPFAIFQYPFGRLTDKWGVLPFILGGSIMYGVNMIVITFLQPGPLAVAMVTLGILAASMLPASLVLVGALSSPNTYGRGMGIFNALGSIGFAAGLLLSAALEVKWDYSIAFIIGGLSVISVVAMTAIPLLGLFRKGSKTE
jgi:MFS family permease